MPQRVPRLARPAQPARTRPLPERRRARRVPRVPIVHWLQVLLICVVLASTRERGLPRAPLVVLAAFSLQRVRAPAGFALQASTVAPLGFRARRARVQADCIRQQDPLRAQLVRLASSRRMGKALAILVLQDSTKPSPEVQVVFLVRQESISLQREQLAQIYAQTAVLEDSPLLMVPRHVHRVLWASLKRLQGQLVAILAALGHTAHRQD